jgi:hypothetical protein
MLIGAAYARAVRFGDATQRVVDSFPGVINPGQTPRDVIGGVPDTARTALDSFDGSADSVDEDADPVQGTGDAFHDDIDAIDEVIDAFQKVVDPCQRVHCMKRLRR